MIDLLMQIKHYLFTPEGLKELMEMGGVWWKYGILCAIIFAETGLFFGFLLPGDSLLFMAGVVAGTGAMNIWLLNALLIFFAIFGDAVGYYIGLKAGDALYKRPDSRFFKHEHLEHTKKFYEKHGKKTIIIARFVPIVRTFAPVVAGIGRMEYRTFASYNVIGGIGWVVSMTFLGYFLGSFAFVQRHLEKMVLLIVFVSILPGIIEYLRHRAAAKAAMNAEAAAAPAKSESE